MWLWLVVGIFLKKVFQNLKAMDQCFCQSLVSGDFAFFRWGGTAAVQLVPYVSFSHQFTFDPRNIKWQTTAPEIEPYRYRYRYIYTHDCAYDTCVLVIRTLTLPVSLHSFHSQHPLSPSFLLVFSSSQQK